MFLTPRSTLIGRGRPSNPRRPQLPHFERKDIRSGRDFEHHAAIATAMHGASRNEEVVMFLGGKAIDVSSIVKVLLTALGRAQILDHGLTINASLGAEIHGGIFSGIQDSSRIRPACNASRNAAECIQ